MSDQLISDAIRLSQVVKLPFLQRPIRRTRILSASCFFTLREISFLRVLRGALVNTGIDLGVGKLGFGRNFDSQVSSCSMLTSQASGDHFLALDDWAFRSLDSNMNLTVGSRELARR